MEMQPVSALLKFLTEQHRVWVRLGAISLEGTWKLVVLEVTAGEAPASWRRVCWRYEHAVFVASHPRGTTVAKWLARKHISASSLSIPVVTEDAVSVERRDSKFRGLYEPLPWPTREWSMRPHSPTGQTIHDELVAADAPVFISFDQAAGAFFGVSPKPNRNFPGCEIAVREQDRRARIERIRVHPTQMVVAVGGNGLHGTQLTLSGISGTSRRLSSRTRQIQLRNSAGVGAGNWLALHRGHELLDRRILDRAWNTDDDDIEVIVEPSTRIGILISSGEQAQVEFKRELPTKDTNNFLRTVAAFANGNGGTILFGVADDGEVVGVDPRRARKERDRLTSLISDRVRPLPEFRAESVNADGRGVIALTVFAGNQVPYGVGADGRTVRFYIRRAATTFPASPADVRAIVESRIPREPTSPLFPRQR